MASFDISPDLDDEIREQMKSGRYGSEEDLLRDALQALKWRDQEIVAIQEGIDDMQAGRTRTLAEFDREFRQRKNIPPDA